MTISQQAFVYLRRELARQLMLPESFIQAHTPIGQLVPSWDRKRVWREAEQSLNLRFPPLALSPGMRRLGYCSVISAAVRAALICIWIGAQGAAFPVGLATLAIGAWLFMELSRPWAVEHPDLKTFDDLVRLIVDRNFRKLQRRFGVKLTREEIFATVKRILVEQLGVAPEKVTWDASFVNDLGMD